MTFPLFHFSLSFLFSTLLTSFFSFYVFLLPSFSSTFGLSLFFEKEFCCIAQIGFKLSVLLPVILSSGMTSMSHCAMPGFSLRPRFLLCLESLLSHCSQTLFLLALSSRGWDYRCAAKPSFLLPFLPFPSLLIFSIPILSFGAQDI